MNVSTENINLIKDYQKQLKAELITSKDTENSENSDNSKEFSSLLTEAIDNVDTVVSKSNENVPKLITGDLDNIHSAMIDMSTSQIVLQSAVQVRNKCIEAYNDIKNMQF
ncbi:flagellar hook-basal body complex protein FliE [Vagococcus carniphilus]|uniref:Flagellar hook-basal body complex protein FliE n=1 Tax=Vagococcus carniphilus TaxID=218144 RepID=A0A430B4U9_9ENTE|nr:flagellar hook-basal body complex protein FliE [Vagococcus carniphilus]MDT2815879.1 flagellar hook-basal body complex protein FliE [Vagococcus carniphilus]MDT2865100.1 flagellar hook-basal body complex protein FliE [Vagococcus carniphilus]QNN71760.1 flagellar hook-basal body complex protein FliE [Vagococcus carniphilus]RSU15328.1 flagellar hook-basal body complex protein FliE [Vagococcus carniphilus]